MSFTYKFFFYKYLKVVWWFRIKTDGVGRVVKAMD